MNTDLSHAAGMTTSHRNLRPLVVAFAAVALLSPTVSACTEATGNNQASSVTRNESDTTPGTALAADSPPPVECFNPYGGQCLGPLEPGTYRTSVFQPGIRYTVPAGWVNAEDLPGNFQLYRQDDPQDGFTGGSYIGIYQDVRIPNGCDEQADPNIGNKPKDLVGWYLDHPGLAASHPRKVKVGGLRGLLVDVPLERDYRGQCPWSEGHPVVPLIIGSGVSSVHHVSLHEIHVRLIVLAWNSANVTIEITSVNEQHSTPEWLRLVNPIIKSLKFARD